MLTDDRLDDFASKAENLGLEDAVLVPAWQFQALVSELREFRKDRSDCEDADVCPLCARDLSRDD